MEVNRIAEIVGYLPEGFVHLVPVVHGREGVEQEGPNADLTIEPQETQIAIDQASRFSQVCRVFAPMYKQQL